MNHGYSLYSNRGCRCDECRVAWAAWNRQRRSRRAQELAEDPSIVEHGSKSTYTNWCCRCRGCTDAHAQAARNGRLP